MHRTLASPSTASRRRLLQRARSSSPVASAERQAAPEKADRKRQQQQQSDHHRHHMVVIEIFGSEIARDAPCFRDPDHLVYGKAEAGGLLIGGYEPDPKPWAEQGIPEYDMTLWFGMWAPGSTSPELTIAKQLRDGLSRFGVDEDAFITGLDVLPGNPTTVHHVIGFEVNPAAFGNRDQMAAGSILTASTMI